MILEPWLLCNCVLMMEFRQKKTSFQLSCPSNCACACCSVRTSISMKFFPRFFLLYFLVFHIYFFSYAYGTAPYAFILDIFILSSFSQLNNFSNCSQIFRIFLLGALYNCSIYASSHSILLESF